MVPRLHTSTPLLFLFQTFPVHCTTAGNASVPSPISFQPSNYWDGNDGAWSTFAVQIGNPPQAVRLLPSITGNSIWTVWSYACEISEIANCPSARGDTYNMTASTTWEEEGNYSLPLNPQHYLPYSGGAVVGFDNTTLDLQGHGGESLFHQVIFAFATNDFHLGSIGLGPKSINISSYNDQIPSFLGSLRDDNLIPSTAWGYLAGASYYSYPQSGFGSLTLGGYDASRLRVNNNLTLAGGSDPYRPFLLGIESITTQDKEMLAEPITTSLDSLTTQIWLPISACQAFEIAFGLIWNETYQLYLLDEETHSALVAQNASVTFVLSTGTSNSTDRLNITLPYAAFDLKASPPLAGSETYYYFPLKQAANETQYTLGRTILQEIYIIADHDRGLVTLYEASYPESSVKSEIITICPPDSTTCFASSDSSSHDSQKLSAAATAGIVIAAVLVVAAICFAIWFKFLRGRSASTPSQLKSEEASTYGPVVGVVEKPELGGEGVNIRRSELEGRYKPDVNESSGDSGYGSAWARETKSGSFEMPSPASPGRNTVESGGTEVQELPGGGAGDAGGAGALDSAQISELPGDFVLLELPDSAATGRT